MVHFHRWQRPIFSALSSVGLLLIISIVHAAQPGNPAWWDIEPCPDSFNRHQASSVDVVAKGLVVEQQVPGWERFCSLIPNPEEQRICFIMVENIFTQASDALSNAADSTAHAYAQRVATVSALELAKHVNLGGPVPAAPNDVADIAALSLQIKSHGDTADAKITRAVLHAEAALRTASNYRDGALPGSVGSLAALRAALFSLQGATAEFTHCHNNLAAWIGAVRAIGFGNWFPPLPPGCGGPMCEGDQEELPLIHEYQSPRAENVFRETPIVIDIDQLPSEYVERTREQDEYDGVATVSRKILSGYYLPQIPLSEGFFIPHPLTLVEWVPAGTLTGVVSIGQSAQIRYAYGRIMLHGAGIDLYYIDADRLGNPLPGAKWSLCVNGGSVYHRCRLDFVTTGSPDEIARGERKSAYWLITSSHGIPNPATGQPVQQMSGFVVQMIKTAEAPRGRCWEWNEQRRQYLGRLGCE